MIKQKSQKKAYEAEIKSYKKVEEGVAAALNGIKGEVLTICDIRGYKFSFRRNTFKF